MAESLRVAAVLPVNEQAEAGSPPAQATSTQVASPQAKLAEPQSPIGGWFCIGLFILAWGISVAFLKRRTAITAWLRARRWTHFPLKIAEWVWSLIGAAIADFFDVFKASSWVSSGSHPYSAVFAVLSLGFLVLATGYLKDGLKESDEERIQELTRSRDKLKKQRDSWVQIAVQIRNVIERKMKRVETLSRLPKVIDGDFVRALDPENQVKLIVQSIYEFFSYELHLKRRDAKLRLGLYMRDRERSGLAPVYSWDGQRHNCMTANPDYMALGNPRGVTSVVVQCYNTRKDPALIVVDDCLNDPTFEFFRPEQKEYLKSMMAFKYRTEHAGTSDALVLALDCDEPKFFLQENSEELQTFLVEMMMRIDYELVIADAAAKVTPAPPVQEAPIPSATKSQIP
jgi:hypothetical protein